MAGVEKTIETFDDLGNLAVSVISIVKAKGISFGTLPKLLDMLNQINELIKDAPLALPELADLDGQEAAQVGGAAFGLVKKVLSAVAA